MTDIEKIECAKYLMTLAENAKEKCDIVGATCILYVINILLDTIEE